MSMDSDKTALVLFGPSIGPCYSNILANDGRISGIEGSKQRPKAEYHEYILTWKSIWVFNQR